MPRGGPTGYSVEGGLRARGGDQEVGGIARQFVPGVAQTAGDLPPVHTVHPGNAAEAKLLQGILARVP